MRVKAARSDATKRAARTAAASEEAADVDRMIHEPMRLKIMSALAVSDLLSFGDLKRLIGATDGNLSIHAQKLEQAGYVACTKRFEGRTPKTEYKLTASGRRAFETYLGSMESMIRAARGR